jgi:hypothetical protein
MLRTRVRRQVNLEVRLQTDERHRWGSGERQRDRTRRLRLDLHFRDAKLRAEARQNGGSSSDRGGMVSALWRYRWRGLSGEVHLSRYVTGSYAARIYEYEYDLPGAYSIRPLHGNGYRSYLRTRIKARNLEIALRYRLQSGKPIRHQFGFQADFGV